MNITPAQKPVNDNQVAPITGGEWFRFLYPGRPDEPDDWESEEEMERRTR